MNKRAGARDHLSAAGGDHHPRQSRVEGQPLHPAPELGQDAIAERSEPFEQDDRAFDRVSRGRLEPVERPRIVSPREDVERHTRQVDPVNVCLAVGTQAVARVPQTTDDTGRSASRAAGSLVGGVLGDPLDHEAVDAAVGVVSSDFLQAGVHDRRDARHGD
jgi:hypothetical protein